MRECRDLAELRLKLGELFAGLLQTLGKRARENKRQILEQTRSRGQGVRQGNRRGRGVGRRGRGICRAPGGTGGECVVHRVLHRVAEGGRFEGH